MNGTCHGPKQKCVWEFWNVDTILGVWNDSKSAYRRIGARKIPEYGIKAFVPESSSSALPIFHASNTRLSVERTEALSVASVGSGRVALLAGST